MSFYQFYLKNSSKKFILYTLELISSKYSKFLHSVEENPPFSSCMDLAIKNLPTAQNLSTVSYEGGYYNLHSEYI